MKYTIALLSLLFIWSCSDTVDDQNTTDVDGTTFPDVNALSGSYANMIAAEDYLYVISDTELISFRQQEDNSLAEIDRQLLGQDLESLHYRTGVLFIGSSQRMYICQLNSENIPVLQSRTLYTDFSDLRPCDPIVANDELAVVSLSSSTQVSEDGCGLTEVNEIRFYNINDLTSPQLVNTHSMTNPKGMALDNNLLFVCEKQAGLKVMNIADPMNPIELYHFEDIDTYDAIATGTTAIVVGTSEIYEFDYSDPTDIHRIWSVKI